MKLSRKVVNISVLVILEIVLFSGVYLAVKYLKKPGGSISGIFRKLTNDEKKLNQQTDENQFKIHFGKITNVGIDNNFLIIETTVGIKKMNLKTKKWEFCVGEKLLHPLLNQTSLVNEKTHAPSWYSEKSYMDFESLSKDRRWLLNSYSDEIGVFLLGQDLIDLVNGDVYCFSPDSGFRTVLTKGNVVYLVGEDYVAELDCEKKKLYHYYDWPALTGILGIYPTKNGFVLVDSSKGIVKLDKTTGEIRPIEEVGWSTNRNEFISSSLEKDGSVYALMCDVRVSGENTEVLEYNTRSNRYERYSIGVEYASRFQIFDRYLFGFGALGEINGGGSGFGCVGGIFAFDTVTKRTQVLSKFPVWEFELKDQKIIFETIEDNNGANLFRHFLVDTNVNPIEVKELKGFSKSSEERQARVSRKNKSVVRKFWEDMIGSVKGVGQRFFDKEEKKQPISKRILSKLRYKNLMSEESIKPNEHFNTEYNLEGIDRLRYLAAEYFYRLNTPEEKDMILYKIKDTPNLTGIFLELFTQDTDGVENELKIAGLLRGSLTELRDELVNQLLTVPVDQTITKNKCFIVIEALDPKYEQTTMDLIESLGEDTKDDYNILRIIQHMGEESVRKTKMQFQRNPVLRQKVLSGLEGFLPQLIVGENQVKEIHSKTGYYLITEEQVRELNLKDFE